MGGLPFEEEVYLSEVVEWAQEQTQFLTPTQAHVLLYLCCNAWTSDNPEGPIGQVLSGRTALRKIQMGTGLSQRTVRYALDALQDNGYIWCKHAPGNGKSQIVIFWSEAADERRAEFRAGVRPLPEGFKREIKRRPKRIAGDSGSNIVQFRSGN